MLHEALVEILYHNVIAKDTITLDEWLEKTETITKEEVVDVAKQIELDMYLFLNWNGGAKVMEKILFEQLQEELYYEKLANGLDVYILPKKGFNKSFATFTTKYGSVDNHFKSLKSKSLLRYRMELLIS